MTARGLRRDILSILDEAGPGPPGGSLAAVDVIAALFFSELRYRVENPAWQGKDWFIFSQPPAALALYAALFRAGLISRGELPIDEKDGLYHPGHQFRIFTPREGVCVGPSELGLSIAIGLALAARLDGRNTRVYLFVGEREQDENQIRNAAVSATRFRLDNILVVVDRRRIHRKLCGEEDVEIAPLRKKWEGFGWGVIGVDGHDFGSILDGLITAREISGRPAVIIAETIEGKGVSFFQGSTECDVVLTREELKRALKEFGG